jgi:hypothetical protein
MRIAGAGGIDPLAPRRLPRVGLLARLSRPPLAGDAEPGEPLALRTDLVATAA